MTTPANVVVPLMAADLTKILRDSAPRAVHKTDIKIALRLKWGWREVDCFWYLSWKYAHDHLQNTHDAKYYYDISGQGYRAVGDAVGVNEFQGFSSQLKYVATRTQGYIPILTDVSKVFPKKATRIGLSGLETYFKAGVKGILDAVTSFDLI